MTATHGLESSRALLRRALAQPDGASRTSPVMDSIAAGMTGNSTAALQSLASAWVQTTIAPAVRRNPYPVLGAAAVAGALLVYARPWQCKAPSALARMLVPLLMTRLLAGKPKPPS